MNSRPLQINPRAVHNFTGNLEQLRYVLGRQTTVVSSLRRFLPESMLERGMRSTVGLGAKGASRT